MGRAGASGHLSLPTWLAQIGREALRQHLPGVGGGEKEMDLWAYAQTWVPSYG